MMGCGTNDIPRLRKHTLMLAQLLRKLPNTEEPQGLGTLLTFIDSIMMAQMKSRIRRRGHEGTWKMLNKDMTTRLLSKSFLVKSPRRFCPDLSSASACHRLVRSPSY